MGESTEDLKFANRREPLALEGLEKLNQLNGRTFAELPKSLQVYFGRQPLQVISLTDKRDLQVRFDLFERLNRGTVTLTAQEVRACVYRGPFNNFLEELAADETFLSLLKLQRARQHDGTKAEQVLKFFAYKNYREEFDGKVSGFCNRYMQHAQSNFDYKRERQRFLDAVQTLSAICKGRPFVRPGISLTPLVQFEACLVAVAELQEEGAEVVVPASDWLRDEELKASSTGATNTRAMLRRRIDRAKVLLGGCS